MVMWCRVNKQTGSQPEMKQKNNSQKNKRRAKTHINFKYVEIW